MLYNYFFLNVKSCLENYRYDAQRENSMSLTWNGWDRDIKCVLEDQYGG